MNDTRKPGHEVFRDARVIRSTGGGSHDWLHVATENDARALIAEYAFRVKYQPAPDGAGGFVFAIR